MKIQAFLLSFLVTMSARAESHLIIPALQAAIGVVEGKPVPEERPENVGKISPLEGDMRGIVLLVARLANGDESVCSATVIDGCLLTAAHCLLEGATYLVYGGSQPDREHPISVAKAAIAKGPKARWPEDDLAVLFLDRPLDERASGTDALATKRLKKRTLYTEFTAVGLGFTGSIHNADGSVDKKGLGTKHTGSLVFAGYEAPPDEKGYHHGEGDVLYAGWGTQMIAQGDSGGPGLATEQLGFFKKLFQRHGTKKKIYGVASMVIGYPKKGQEFLPEDAREGVYASVPDNRDWILDNMKRLRCKQNTRANLTSMAVAEARRYPKSDLPALKESVRRLLNIPDDLPFFMRFKKGEVHQATFGIYANKQSAPVGYVKINFQNKTVTYQPAPPPIVAPRAVPPRIASPSESGSAKTYR